MGRGAASFRVFTAAVVALAATAGPALAHGSERGFVLLMPTGFVAVGGALAVAASFLAMAAVPDRWVDRLLAARLPLGTWRRIDPAISSTLSALVLAAVLAFGWFGIRDPLMNPLPLTIWTLWWVVVTLAHPLLGNVWVFLNPFTGPYRLLDRALGGRLSAERRDLPERFGYLPAIAIFLAFAWFELVYPAPDDPERLATAVAVYAIVTFALVCTFGDEAWLGRGDPFAVFFRLLSGLSPFRTVDAGGGRRRLELVAPGAKLADAEPLPWSGVLFLLLTLSTVSFDGLSKTFWYLGQAGINPLEFPGRTAVMGLNTVGLLVAFAVLAGAFALAAWLGRTLSGTPLPTRALAGRLVLSIVPISTAFHLAHYLTVLLINGQFALLAANDPFGLGWNLIGLRDTHVTTSFMTSRDGSILIWTIQTAAIVAGHLLAVFVAHALLVANRRAVGRVMAAEAPLAAVMVLYTLFGLWLLSAPVAG